MFLEICLISDAEWQFSQVQPYALRDHHIRHDLLNTSVYPVTCCYLTTQSYSQSMSERKLLIRVTNKKAFHLR